MKGVGANATASPLRNKQALASSSSKSTKQSWTGLITLAVGGLGMAGINRLATALSLTFSNCLVSVSNINETFASLTAHNRGLYGLLDAQSGDVSEETNTRLFQNLTTDLTDTEKAFTTYRATPLENDERVAGDEYEKLWPGYVAGAQKVKELIDAGDLAQARNRLNALSVEEFKKSREYLRIMIDSNKRQIKEGAQMAQELKTSSTLMLQVGIVIAFMVATALGILITRMITRPLAVAVASAQRIAGGDLTQSISTTRGDEAGQLLNALADMQGGLRHTIQEIASTSDQLASAAEELSAATEESTHRPICITRVSALMPGGGSGKSRVT